MAYLEENAGATGVQLDADDLRDLGELRTNVAGNRYDDAGLAMVEH